MADSLTPRASTRYAVQIPIAIAIGERTLAGTTQNLSLGGTCVTLAERLAVGGRVRLSLPTSDQPIQVDGEVRWSNPSETGIQFASLRARAVWDLNQFFDGLARSR